MTKTLGGRPITGDIGNTNISKPVEQWGEEKFIELLDAVFAANERVAALGWYQYTPSFNDGDPCVSPVGTERLIVFDEVPHSINYDTVIFDEDEYEEVYPGDDPRVTTVRDLRGPGAYETRNGKWDWYPENPDAPIDPLYTAGNAFYNALDGGHFDHLIQEHFGDGSQIIATRDGFDVGYYECGY